MSRGLFNLANEVKYKKRKIDDQALISYVAKHPDATLEEIGSVFEVSAVGIWKACKRLQITRKKKRFFTKKEMRHLEKDSFVR